MKRQGGYKLVVRGKTGIHTFSIYSLKDIREKPITFRSIDLPAKTWIFTYTHSELIQRIEARKYEYCNTTKGHFQIHHIRKLRDVEKGKHRWEKVMVRRRRKTLVLCVPCHHKLHAGGEPGTLKCVSLVRMVG